MGVMKNVKVYNNDNGVNGNLSDLNMWIIILFFVDWAGTSQWEWEALPLPLAFALPLAKLG